MTNFVDDKFGLRSAFIDAISEDSNEAHLFYKTLFEMVAADTVVKEIFEQYCSALTNLPDKGKQIACWTVATVIPFMARPDIHAFLKPTETKHAAEVLQFNLNYDAQPNGSTYKCNLEMLQECKREIAYLNPADMIDLQSYLYTTCGGYK